MDPLVGYCSGVKLLKGLYELSGTFLCFFLVEKRKEKKENGHSEHARPPFDKKKPHIDGQLAANMEFFFFSWCSSSVLLGILLS
jgi:hypothetical protein